jgi:prevent-host-death family protein
MGDYKIRRGRPGRKTVGIRELKANAAGIVRHVREAHASYVVTHRGRPVGVILPVDGENERMDESEPVDPPAAWQTFLNAGRRLEPKFRRGASGIRALSDMRR